MSGYITGAAPGVAVTSALRERHAVVGDSLLEVKLESPRWDQLRDENTCSRYQHRDEDTCGRLGFSRRMRESDPQRSWNLSPTPRQPPTATHSTSVGSD